MTLREVIVVGAGMSGLICAQRLRAAGYAVRVLEKSRGLGGRMATRRIDGVPLDHGARFIHPQGEMLQALTQHWITQGVLQAWQPHTFYLDSTGQLNPDPDVPPVYVAPAGMSAIGKALSAGLTIYRQERAIAIAPHPDTSTWTITTERADDGATQQYAADALILAIPAPQMLPLLAPLQAEGAIADLWQTLANVTYAPCITVMAQYPPPVAAPDSRLPCHPCELWAIEGHSDTPFFWVGLDSSKRDAEGYNIVLHSSATFAEHWLEQPHLQPAGEALLGQAAKLIAPWLARPTRWQVHRWRYSQVEQPYTGEIPLVTAPAPLVACGDWWGDRHIDSAIDAGWAAAAALNAQLDNRALPDSPLEMSL